MFLLSFIILNIFYWDFSFTIKTERWPANSISLPEAIAVKTCTLIRSGSNDLHMKASNKVPEEAPLSGSREKHNCFFMEDECKLPLAHLKVQMLAPLKLLKSQLLLKDYYGFWNKFSEIWDQKQLWGLTIWGKISHIKLFSFLPLWTNKHLWPFSSQLLTVNI